MTTPTLTGPAGIPDDATLADRWDRATFLFDSGDYISAARVLDGIVTEEPTATHARLLLARAYYHSAQLGRAEELLTRFVEEHSTDGYARLLLGRTLQRRSRHDEAATHLRVAGALNGG